MNFLLQYLLYMYFTKILIKIEIFKKQNKKQPIERVNDL